MKLTREMSVADWEANQLKVLHDLPWFEIPDCLEMKVVPNFGGSIARFNFRLKGKKDSVSVYLDAFDMLGHMKQPYWEIYPDSTAGCCRYVMGEESKMFEEILLALGHEPSVAYKEMVDGDMGGL